MGDVLNITLDLFTFHNILVPISDWIHPGAQINFLKYPSLNGELMTTCRPAAIVKLTDWSPTIWVGIFAKAGSFLHHLKFYLG